MLQTEGDSKSTKDKRISARLERRKALKVLGAGGACCLLSSVAAQAATRTSIGDHDSLDVWTKRIGSRFELRGPGDESIVRFLQLSEVIENSWIRERDADRPSHLRPASISLVFQGPREIPSAGYRLFISPTNIQTVFLNPIGRHGCPDGTAYEVILN